VRRQFPAIPDFTRRSWQKRQADAELVQSILDGKEYTMPPFGEKLSEKQARELVAYVRTFGPKPAGGEQQSARDFDKRFRQLEAEMTRLQRESQRAAAPSPRRASRQATRLAAGGPAGSEGGAVSRLYRQHCQKCHGADGTGSPARARLPRLPDFTDTRWQRRRTDARLLASVLDGKGSQMPAFEEKINDDQARELVATVRGFGGRQPRPGTVPGGAPEASHPQGLPRQPAEPEEEGLPEESRSGRLIGWLGRFHPAMVHFPIGLLVAATLAEALLVVTGRTLFDSAGRVCVWFGALGAVLAATLGWFLGGPHVTDADWILTSHRWLGTSTAACAVVVLVLSEVSRRPGRPGRGVFRVVLLLSAGLVLATGLFGGALMHGLDYYAWPPHAAAHLRGDDHRSGRGGEAVDGRFARVIRRREPNIRSPRALVRESLWGAVCPERIAKSVDMEHRRCLIALAPTSA
jgi:mono/diheme cytochrome c family protein/uncharacterized membrane protein